MTQGSVSNVNGLAFRRAIEQTLAEAGIPFEVEHRVYTDWQGGRPKHDIVATFPDGPRVIECKYHGDKPGSLPQKLMYAVFWLSELAVESVVVLGGHWPPGVVARCKAHAPETVKVMTEQEWRMHLGPYRGKPVSGAPSARPVLDRPALDGGPPPDRLARG